MKNRILEPCFFCKNIPIDFNTETLISDNKGFKLKVISCWNCRKSFHEWYNKQVKKFVKVSNSEEVKK